ncbi:hypothetical protein D9757_011865 [Collybiopsis confluens]|uniref:Uncharacterized protein n=1 Tax=Collybiopsis confluens TaxID=2823264 RepID=A0A8H5D3V5_9AGAR|nr:hypothetical protein D9757_011865 [Collybiopsis confluens]
MRQALVVGDLALIIIPLRLLWRMSLESNKRSTNLISTIFTVLHAVFYIGKAWNLLTITVKAEFGAVLIAANLSVLTPYIYRLVNPEGDFDSKPCTYYRSFQSDGGFRMRRMADIAPGIHTSSPYQLPRIRAVQVCSDIRLPEVAIPDLEPIATGQLEENTGRELNSVGPAPLL